MSTSTTSALRAQPAARHLPAPKVPVSCVLTCRLGGDGPDGRALITKGDPTHRGATRLYYIAEFATPLGRAFSVLRAGNAEAYDVLIGTDPRDTCCSCKGWSYCGTCKHLSSLLHLIATGAV